MVNEAVFKKCRKKTKDVETIEVPVEITEIPYRVAVDLAKLLKVELERRRSLISVTRESLDERDGYLYTPDADHPFFRISSERGRITEREFSPKAVVAQLAAQLLRRLPEDKVIQVIDGRVKVWIHKIGVYLEFQAWLDAAWEGSATILKQ